MKTSNNKEFCITQNYECITSAEVFPKVLEILMAYSHKLIGNSTLRLKKGRDELAYDFAMEAIQKHLQSPDKFDPKRNPDLIKYLKFNILRQLISNFKKKSSEVLEIGYETDDAVGISVENYFLETYEIHEQIDLKNLVEKISSQLSTRLKLLEVFELRYLKDYTRKEVCETLEISFGEYANRTRRLETVIKRIIKEQGYE